MKKLISFFLLATITTAMGWAADETITFSAKGYTNAQTIETVNGTNFTILFSKGTNSNAPKYYTNGSAIRVYGGNTFTVSSSTKTIIKIEITFGMDDGSNAITTDVEAYSNGTWTGSSSSVKFTVGGTSGNRRLSAIAVTYQSTPSTPTVTGIAAFKNVASGTTVQLYLPDDYNARVTHVEAGTGGTVDAYVRDDTGAMRMTGISPNREMKYNQHLAGWITGKYTAGSDGIPQFVPVDGLTNTTQLVIADPVTENDTKPVAISYNDRNNHLADWVEITEMEVNNNIDASKFNLNYQDQAYNGAIVDISAIVANGKLYPVDDLNKTPVTFVVGADKDFTSPSQDIDNTSVRLSRSLRASQWSLLTVPFDIDDFDGEAMEYDGVTLGKVGSYDYNGNTYDIQGGVMHFKYTSGTLKAGTPYLVKPNSSISADKVYSQVTLSRAPAATITKNLSATQSAMGINMLAQENPVWAGDYSLVGSYSPRSLNKDEATVMLTGDDNLSWTSLVEGEAAINGTEAYITIPSGAGVAFDLATGAPVITAITTVAMHHEQHAEPIIYNLMGVRLTRPLSELPPGIYIVNGKKIVKY